MVDVDSGGLPVMTQATLWDEPETTLSRLAVRMRLVGAVGLLLWVEALRQEWSELTAKRVEALRQLDLVAWEVEQERDKALILVRLDKARVLLGGVCLAVLVVVSASGGSDMRPLARPARVVRSRHTEVRT